MFTGEDAAFADDLLAPGHQRRQPVGYRQVGGEGVQIAVVDPDDLGAGVQRHIEFAFVVDLHQALHPVCLGCFQQFLQLAWLQDGHDEQQSVGPGGPGLHYLVGVEYEIFAQHRGTLGRSGRFDLAQVVEFPLEPGVGQARNGGCPVACVGLGQLQMVEVRHEKSPGGRGLLHLGDESHSSAQQRPGKVKGPRLGGGSLLQVSQGHLRLALCQLDALGSDYFI